MATRVDYANGIDATDIGTIYLTGAGYVNYPFRGASRESALGWEEPVFGGELNRNIDLVLDVDNVDYGLVARCEISYKYLNVQDYRVLCKIAKQKVCTANFFNRETGTRVTQEMAFTGNEIGKLYKFGTEYLGVLDMSIKLVATNRDRQDIISATHTITYNANGGTGTIAQQSVKWAGQKRLADSGFTKSGYVLTGWNTQPDGTGLRYKLGQELTVFGDLTLYSEWDSTSETLVTGNTFNKLARTNHDNWIGHYDMVIEKFVFGKYSNDLDEFIVDGENVINGLEPVDITENNSKGVNLYRSKDGKTIYILTKQYKTIYANPNSDAMFASFDKARTIENINLLNTSNVTTMRNMFYRFSALTDYCYLDLSSFDTTNVTDMHSIFSQTAGFFNSGNQPVGSCYINISNWNTENVEDIGSMFSDCGSWANEFNIVGLDFDTTKVMDMSYSFERMGQASSADIVLTLSKFSTRNVTNTYRMFNTCSKLKTIYVNPLIWDMSNVTNSSDMFRSCYNLVGGNGTTYNSSYTDKTYARVDTPSTPGYLTAIV